MRLLAAFHRMIENEIYANTTRTKENFYSTLIHEFLHAVAAQKIHVDVEDKKIQDYRNGYQIQEPNMGDRTLKD